MAFVPKFTKDGSSPITRYLPIAAVNIDKGELVYWDGSGAVTTATATDCDTDVVVGVAEETVNNSGGNTMAKNIAVQGNGEVIYEVLTSGTMATAYVGDNVPVFDGGNIMYIDPDAGTTTTAGVCKIEKYISSSKALVSINFGPQVT